MKLPLKCEQDCSPGQEGGHKHLGVGKPGPCGTGHSCGRVPVVIKLPALPDLES